MTIDITKMIEPAKAVLAPAGGTLGEAWAAVLGDRIAAWRLRNAAALQIQVNRELQKMGLRVDRSRIPERYAIAWFEEATKQDEPEIQALFARLLAKAAAGDPDAADRRLVEIVGRLTPIDAQVLRWLFDLAGPPPRHLQIAEWEAWRAAKASFGEAATLSIEHVVVLGIFERQFSLKQEGGLSSWHTVEAGYPVSRLVDEISGDMTIVPDLSASTIGLSLYAACFGEPSPKAGIG